MVDGSGLENRHTRKGIGGSNPSLSATQSGQQRYLPIIPLEIDRIGRNSSNPSRKADRRKCPAYSCKRVPAPFSLEGQTSSPVSRTHSGECNAITNRSRGESSLDPGRTGVEGTGWQSQSGCVVFFNSWITSCRRASSSSCLSGALGPRGPC